MYVGKEMAALKNFRKELSKVLSIYEVMDFKNPSMCTYIHMHTAMGK